MDDQNRLWFVGGYNGQGQGGVGNTSNAHMRLCSGQGWLSTQYVGDKWEAVEISTGGAYNGSAHYHNSAMLGNDGYVYTTGQYGGYGNGSTSSRNSWGRWTIPVGLVFPVKSLASGYTGNAYSAFPADMRTPRDSSGTVMWEPEGLTCHSYTSEVGTFVRLKNGQVWAAGRNANNKLGVSNYRDGNIYPTEPHRVRLGV
jgi:hypothetical protein